VKPVAGRGGKAKRRNGQMLQRALLLARRQDVNAPFAETRERPGGPRRRGGGGARAEAEARKALHQIGEKRRLAAEEMIATRDLHQDAVGLLAQRIGIGRGPGRVAPAPVGELLQAARIARRIGRMHVEVGDERHRIGDELARRDAGLRGGAVPARDALAALRRHGKRERPLRVEGPAPQKALHRPVRQENRNNPPLPAHAPKGLH